MKLKFFGFLALLCVFVCCASPGAKQAKIYQSKLETMLGDETGDVVAVIKDWKYEAMEQWEEENPSVDEIKKYNRAGCGFSEKEIQEIFASEGKYTCMLFLKKVGEDVASLGLIDSTGMGDLKDASVAAERFSLIRVVFKDGQFINFKIWPSLSQASLSRRKENGHNRGHMSERLKISSSLP
jgi:hypothetical protein